MSGGDWMCGACQHINFKKRDSCQRCSCPKYATSSEISSYGSINLNKNNTEILAGDWYCCAMNCGAHNYASRTSCYRCGALKYDYGYGSGGAAAAAAAASGGGYGYDHHHATPGWKTGDWICTRHGCGIHNYASRMECYKCKTPREFGG